MVKMKWVSIWFCLMVMGLSVLAYPSGNEDNNEPMAMTFFQWDDFLVQHMPGSYFYPFVIENYVPDATYLTESNNGFALVDRPRVYFEGDSYIHFNWFYNGVNINSYLNDGSPGVLLPFSSISRYCLQGENPSAIDYGMDFIPGFPGKDGSQAMVSGVLPDMGGYWLKFMIQPAHPTERADRLYHERRRIEGNFFFDYRFDKTSKSSGSHWSASLSYFDISRQFNDFNIFDKTFNDDGRMFLFDTRFRKNQVNGYYELFGVFNYLERGRQGAELGDFPEETETNERLSLLTGFRWLKKRLDLRFSLLWEREDVKAVEPNFTRDLLDNDGDNILPYGSTDDQRLGRFSATTFNLSVRTPIIQRLKEQTRGWDITPFADMRYTVINGDETPHDFNGITMAGVPYQVVQWTGGDLFQHPFAYRGGTAKYTNTNLYTRAGLKVDYEISPAISLLGHVFFNYNRLGFDYSKNNISQFNMGFDAGVYLFKNRRTHLLFALGMTPYDLRSNVNFFLETQRPWGYISAWEDKNRDGVFQVGESGEILGITGGVCHSVDEAVEIPQKQRVLLYFSTPISRNYTFNLKAIYKHISHRLRVNDGVERGFFEEHAGQRLRFIDARVNGDIYPQYILTNGGYTKDPFYAGLLLNVTGRKENKWFFSFSFLAHMGMADTAFGNGPGSNDFGILDESQADPNTWINGFGRVDGERGFVAKSYFGFYLCRDLFLGVSLKYRDGNPFAFLNRVYAHNQWVIYYSTIKAEDQKGKKGGPREDYLADVSFQLRYQFKLFNRAAYLSLAVFNILDFGAELSEYVYSGGPRDSMELQIPRSLRLTFGYRF